MNRSAAHTALVKSILAEFGSLPGVLLVINESGRARYMSNSGKEYFVPYGFPESEGGPDILGVIAPRGSLFGLECKTGEATSTKVQRVCREGLAGFGVVVTEVHSIDDARDAIAEAKNREKLERIITLEALLDGLPDGDARTILLDKIRDLHREIDTDRARRWT